MGHSNRKNGQLTARLYEATATAYFGYRVYARGASFQSLWLKETMQKALDSMMLIADEIENYPMPVTRGQWNWIEDVATVRNYHKLITQTGLKEYGNVVFAP